MKARIVQAHGEFKVGDSVDIPAKEFAVLLEDGLAVSESEWTAIQANKQTEANTIKAREARVDEAINRASDENRIVPRADTSEIKASALVMEAAREGTGVKYILSLPVLRDLEGRVTPMPGRDNAPTAGLTVTASLDDCAKGVIQAMEPQQKLIRANNWPEAMKLSKEAGLILKHRMITPAVSANQDFMLRDLVKAATFTDPNSQIGSLAADLIIMRNLGYLVYKLPWIKKLTTDLTGEPARFGQQILTRYITPPGVLTWVPGVGFTNATAEATSGTAYGLRQITDSGTGTTQSAGKTLRVDGPTGYELDADNAYGVRKVSVPSTTDRGVLLNMFKATEIEFPVSLLAGTVRNLFGEQLGAQTYSLAEEISKFVLGMFALPTAAQYNSGSAWGTGGVSGLTYSYTKALANWNLSGMIGVKNKMTIAKIPDVGRFVLLHSFYHDKLLEDANLLSAKAIMALIHKNEAEFNTGELPTLFGVQPLESQLASWTDAGALTVWTDDTNPGGTSPAATTAFGFAGNMSSGIFVARPPQDFTQVANQLGIPITASIRLMTEPDSNLTVMVFAFVDNGKMAINQRVCLMYGAAQGDPRQGFPLKIA